MRNRPEQLNLSTSIQSQQLLTCKTLNVTVKAIAAANLEIYESLLVVYT
jgi:hypothetical protein